MGKEIRSHWVVSTLGGIARMIVATTYMGVDGQSLKLALDGEVVHLEILQRLMLQCEAIAQHRLPIVIIHDHAPSTVVELHGATTCCINLLKEGAISLGDILDQLLGVRIELTGILRIVATEQL